MKQFALTIFSLCLLLLTACGNDTLDNRVYTQGLGISGGNDLTLTFQRFEDTVSHTIHAENLSEALRKQEANNGGEIFTGHTELLCIDRSPSMKHIKELFYQQWISPNCKVIFTDPENFLQNYDCTQMVHTIRMAEENGILPVTDLSTVLNEWMGMGKTALMPVPAGKLPALVLLRQNGDTLRLSDEAIRGMYWLRESGTKNISYQGKDVSVKVIRLEKRYENQELCYHLAVKISDNAPEIQSLIHSDCEKAIAEMCSFGADVIGIQEIMKYQNLNTIPEISVKVHALNQKEVFS